VTVIVGLAILFGGIIGLSNYAKTRVMKVWHVRFPQTGGLGPGDEVQVNGMRKGAVRSMALLGDSVVIDLGLAREIVLTHDSRVAIRNVGLMGEKVIAVDLRTSGEVYSTRDTIEGVFEHGMPEVLASLGVAVTGMKSLAAQLDSLSSALSAGGIAATVTNIRKTSEQLRLTVEENRAQLRATVENFAAASKSARAATAGREVQIRQAMDHFASAAENLDHVSGRLDSLRASLQSVASKLDKGQGSLGKLVNDDKVYADLAGSAKALRSMIEEMKTNPTKYFKFSVFK
jgi:phospholipid/cholesterol/gamma-HCH transport system substrate-binding protein